MSASFARLFGESARASAATVVKFGCFLHVVHDYVLEVTMVRASIAIK